MEPETYLEAAQLLAAWYASQNYIKETKFPDRNVGKEYVQRRIDGSDTLFFERTRMSKPTFHILIEELKKHGMQETKNATVEEQFFIFLYIVNNGATNRLTQDRFEHSGSTISSYFNASLKALHSFARTLLVQPTGNTVPDEIRYSDKYFPYFINCVGALDGTHIPAMIKGIHELPFINRKKYMSQNCLIACSFDLQFQYALAGWEGSAHDSLILSTALGSKDLVIPYGKYFLGDAGFRLTSQILTPYRGVRYHLREWFQGKRGYKSPRTLVSHTTNSQLTCLHSPVNKEELFNLRHAKLRNAIERIFGVLKKRFVILQKAVEYPFETQVYK